MLRLAGSVMRFLDTPPGVPESSQRESDMKKLIALLQKELDADDAQGLPAIVENVAAALH